MFSVAIRSARIPAPQRTSPPGGFGRKMGSESFAPERVPWRPAAPSGVSDISCLSARYPPRSQRRTKVSRIAPRAGFISCSSYRQGASKLEFIFLIPPVLTARSDEGGFPPGRIAYHLDPAGLLAACAGLYSILFISARTFRVQAFFITANNCFWPSDFYVWEKIYLLDRN